MTIDNWTPATVEDQRLAEAQRFDDENMYLAALARADVFVPRKEERGAMHNVRKTLDKVNKYSIYGQLNSAIRGTSKSALTVATEYATTRKGMRLVLPVYTRALLPTQRPEGVYFHHYMFPGWAEQVARQRPTMLLLVNPGTPLERELHVGQVGQWLKQNPQAIGRWSDLRGTIRTVWNEPVEGELARALACGAHLAVYNAVPWNTMGHEMLDYVNERETLQEWWGVEGPEDWRHQANALVDTEHPGAADLVLNIRIERGAGMHPSGDLAADTAALTQAVTDWCRERNAPEGMWRDLTDIAQWVTRCEAWMRLDAVLPVGGVVKLQGAWDLGRAVNMARWGLNSGYCDRATAEQLVRYAGGLCAQIYGSWDELSTAYILGRVIKMGRQGDPERTYRESLALHQALMRDPGSPWRNLSLR